MRRKSLDTVRTAVLILSGAAALKMLFFRSDISDTFFNIVGSADMIALVCIMLCSVRSKKTNNIQQ